MSASHDGVHLHSSDVAGEMAPAAASGSISVPAEPAAFASLVADLVRRHGEQRDARQQQINDTMALRHEAEARFVAMKPLLADALMQPPLTAIAAQLTHARLEVADTPVGVEHRLTCERSEQFPVTASLTVGAILDVTRHEVRLFTRTELIPMLVTTSPGVSHAVTLDELDALGRAPVDRREPDGDPVGPRWAHLRTLLNNAALTFLRTYLRTELDPNYQRMATYADPVCGMKLHSGLVAARHRVRGHTYCFCSKACAERFAGDPDFYLSYKRER